MRIYEDRPQYSLRVWRIETLALCASLFFAATCNLSFWRSFLSAEPGMSSLRVVFCAALVLVGAHWLLLLILLNRWTLKWVLYLLCMGTALAAFFMDRFGVVIDQGMLINALQTDLRESWELASPTLGLYLVVLGVLPAWLISQVEPRKMALSQALWARLLAIAAALLMLLGGFWAGADVLIPSLQMHRELRYRITPGNFVVAASRLATDQIRTSGRVQGQRTSIGTDARIIPDVRKPTVLILVVGETVRAANWGLGTYHRQTTPELAALNVFNFSDVTSCGTDTATSLPCMFSLTGRRNYDRTRIVNSESLLHVLEHAGVRTLWRDNQSGCKGVCDGLEFEDLSHRQDAVLCKTGRCYDEILLERLDALVRSATRDTVIVLHMLGNHGPEYHRRYPEAFGRWLPVCTSAAFSACPNPELVNAYDNAVLYTDHVLAKIIKQLRPVTTQFTGLLFVSDHGESLGERNIYLHGMPYSIAPNEQRRVPMVFWMSDTFAASRRLARGCLRESSGRPVQHDHLFHSVLGLLNVQTSAYDPAWDLFRECRALT